MSRVATELAKQKTEQRLAETASEAYRTKPKSPRENQAEEFVKVRDTHLARLEIIARAKDEAQKEHDLDLRRRTLEVIEWMEKEWGIE